MKLFRLPLMKRQNSCFYKSTLIFLFFSREKSYESYGSSRNNDVFQNRQQRKVRCRLELGFAFLRCDVSCDDEIELLYRTTNYFIDILYFC